MKTVKLQFLATKLLTKIWKICLLEHEKTTFHAHPITHIMWVELENETITKLRSRLLRKWKLQRH